jgi:hypothetical protein
MSEVYEYATRQVNDTGKKASLEDARRHFAAEGKEVVRIKISRKEEELMSIIGLGTYEDDGQLYAIATVETIQRSKDRLRFA